MITMLSYSEESSKPLQVTSPAVVQRYGRKNLDDRQRNFVLCAMCMPSSGVHLVPLGARECTVPSVLRRSTIRCISGEILAEGPRIHYSGSSADQT